MPTYEYACKGCGEHLEVVQSFKDDALTDCPSCGGSLRKVFSAAGIIFKGSGWHIKDYGSSKSSANAANSSGSSDDSSSGSSGSSSDSSSSSDGSSSTSSSTSEKSAGSGGSSTGSSKDSSGSSAKKSA